MDVAQLLFQGGQHGGQHLAQGGGQDLLWQTCDVSLHSEACCIGAQPLFVMGMDDADVASFVFFMPVTTSKHLGRHMTKGLCVRDRNIFARQTCPGQLLLCATLAGHKGDVGAGMWSTYKGLGAV